MRFPHSVLSIAAFAAAAAARPDCYYDPCSTCAYCARRLALLYDPRRGTLARDRSDTSSWSIDVPVCFLATAASIKVPAKVSRVYNWVANTI